MGRSTNSFSKLDVKIKPSQKKHTIPNWNIPKSSQIRFIIIFHKISYMSLGKKLTPYNADHRPALGAGNISCTATDGDPRWHNVSQKMLRLMVHFSWGWLGLDISWYMAYIYMAWDICWHMLTYVDICWPIASPKLLDPWIRMQNGSTTAWLSRCQAAQTVMRPSAPPLQMYLPGSNGATWELLPLAAPGSKFTATCQSWISQKSPSAVVCLSSVCSQE